MQMASGLMAISEGISAEADANTNAQLNADVYAITLVGIFLNLQKAWSETLNQDTQNLYIETLKEIGVDGSAAAIASLNEQRNIDSTASDEATGQIDTAVQGQKGVALTIANAMTPIFTLQDSVFELLKTEADALHK
jgi:hypothetical protein